jgi:hypothetical protein
MKRGIPCISTWSQFDGLPCPKRLKTEAAMKRGIPCISTWSQFDGLSCPHRLQTESREFVPQLAGLLDLPGLYKQIQ